MNKRQQAGEETLQMANRIWMACRTELFLSMRYLGPALDALPSVYDRSTQSLGTDGVCLRYRPDYLFRTWLAHPYRLNRALVHMLLHCLFLHMYSAKEREDAGLWDLCCDIAVESILDGMEAEAVYVPPSDLREEWYRRLDREVHAMTAERLYAWFLQEETDPAVMAMLEREFCVDDHGFWSRLEDPKSPPRDQAGGSGSADGGRPPGREEDSGRQEEENKERWQDRARRLQEDLHAAGAEASGETGQLTRVLRASLDHRTDYRDWLARFAILREEAGIDPDSFDYSFYTYGLSLYGNMPLIEENEFRESKKVDSLVIAIDTSASCQASLVQEFVSETMSILLSEKSFFRTVDICIIECDNQIQRVDRISCLDQAREWADHFTVSGGYGTDFRPVFAEVERLQGQGALRNLRGLLYFTDGQGIYPDRATPYETAFLLWDDRISQEAGVPDWALTLHRSLT